MCKVHHKRKGRLQMPLNSTENQIAPDSRPTQKCDIFISYRRDGGDMSAMHIYEALKDRGYDVFYDIEMLRSGKFNEALLDSIQSCKDFVLILSPHALDRCSDENDWVRREIAEALKAKKNIVPVIMRGFSFPEKLPDDIDEVRYRNGLTSTTEYFSESIDRLCERYLVTKPPARWKRKGRSALMPAIIALIALIIVLGILFALNLTKKDGFDRQHVPIRATIPPSSDEAAEVTAVPKDAPKAEPTAQPVATPTPEVTPAPTATPEITAQPTSEITPVPKDAAKAANAIKPVATPTTEATSAPTATPEITAQPTSDITPVPKVAPKSADTAEAVAKPTAEPAG